MGPAPLHLAVQYASDGPAPTRAQIRRWVRASLAVLAASRPPGVEEATLTFRFVDEDEGRTLNRAYRQRDYATNVLTFVSDETAERSVEADIAVCVPVVEREAREQRKSFASHCAHLVVHGTLHACGLDHESDDEATTMEALERVVLKRFRIDDPYRVAQVDDRPSRRG